MKEQIIEKATEMFLNIGFKSVTMDDISAEMGISKKTVYQFFKNKSDLVEHCCNHILNIISTDIEEVESWNLNPIEEMYEARKIVLRRLKNEKTSPAYQLEKYYPKIFESLRKERFKKMDGCVISNLKKGMDQGYYRKGLDINIISKIYHNGLTGLKEKEMYWPQQYTVPYLMNVFLEYHIRAIATPKGIETLDEILVKDRNKSSVQPSHSIKAKEENNH
ncbi:TetR/AcrR family transcriptional regulator [Sinomicrobium weinanense]|uniref:TetR/AcrR family transcriptional regulator n=1 Tax=Sinomicrobium weinanense TaxID=2842200 RepID=A0A926JPB1_9FLAO|nr:TetR/AcrR family transcriptional regulator [Sinomicrobium weinanense]MBC9794911.1 TetR/AcrR family transcriptional regulator [Sinomicrobium weinanense]MBU3125682.1 TetR/AcrR family transcriptional regulator [Sinomicrobium weinanense]